MALRFETRMQSVGVGHEYWHNKYGNPPEVGTQVNAPQSQLEWHF